MIDRLRELGYDVGWAQGGTPDELREAHREAGWAWEGDTHAGHDGEPIQHNDPNAPGYVPEHRVLADDSGQVTIWWVQGLNGFEHSDGTPIEPAVQLYLRDDATEDIQSLIDSHPDRLAELELQATETPDETAERHAREAEERAAEDD